MTIYILILYAWTISSHAGSGMTTAEFTSLEKCTDAARQAKSKFDGALSEIYFVCVPK